MQIILIMNSSKIKKMNKRVTKILINKKEKIWIKINKSQIKLFNISNKLFLRYWTKSTDPMLFLIQRMLLKVEFNKTYQSNLKNCHLPTKQTHQFWHNFIKKSQFENFIQSIGNINHKLFKKLSMMLKNKQTVS